MNTNEIKNKYDHLLRRFGNYMAQQRELKNTIVSGQNPFDVEFAREKLKECVQKAEKLKTEIFDLLTAGNAPEKIVEDDENK